MMTFREALGLLLPSMQARGVAQLTSVALVILSLLFFQTMIVGLPSTQATLTALGLALDVHFVNPAPVYLGVNHV
jgi:hypothetical protein